MRAGTVGSFENPEGHLPAQLCTMETPIGAWQRLDGSFAISDHPGRVCAPALRARLPQRHFRESLPLHRYRGAGLRIVRLINLHLTVGAVLRRSNGPDIHARRFAEVDEILAIARRLDRAPALLVGDFNCSPAVNSDVYGRIVASGFADAFTTAGRQRSADAVTWDQNNPINAAGCYRHAPSQRIDHVFVPLALASSVVPVMTRIDFNNVTIDVGRGRRVPLSDHYGLSVSLALGLKNRQRSAEPASAPRALAKQALPAL